MQFNIQQDILVKGKHMHPLLIQRYLILHEAIKPLCRLCTSEVAHRPLPTVHSVTLAPLKIPACLSSRCRPLGSCWVTLFPITYSSAICTAVLSLAGLFHYSLWMKWILHEWRSYQGSCQPISCYQKTILIFSTCKGGVCKMCHSLSQDLVDNKNWCEFKKGADIFTESNMPLLPAKICPPFQEILGLQIHLDGKVIKRNHYRLAQHFFSSGISHSSLTARVRGEMDSTWA